MHRPGEKAAQVAKISIGAPSSEQLHADRIAGGDLTGQGPLD